MRKILTFFQQKIKVVCNTYILNFNETLTNDVVNFEQPAPEGRHYEPHDNIKNDKCDQQRLLFSRISVSDAGL